MCYVSMGCINTKRDTCPTVFHVVNVDDSGRHLNAGQLEVTDLELVFYQRGRPPIRWPLKTLRRYGFDTDHFSFEFGRKSPTGPGVYEFLCKRAEQLVNLLETRLQIRPNNENGHENARRVSHRLSSISSGGPLSPIGSTNPTLENSSIVPIPRAVSQTQNIYSNEEIIATALGSPSTSAPATHDESNNNMEIEVGEHTYANTLLGGGDCENVPGHVYMNIVPGTNSVLSEYHARPVPPQMVTYEPEEPIHNYANLDLESELDVVSRQQVAPVPASLPFVNYIVLDLDSGGEPPPPRSPSNSLPPDSPRKPPMGYATIDFDKTTALSHSVDPCFDDSDCSRKTRHNSTICQLPRNSSSLSD